MVCRLKFPSFPPQVKTFRCPEKGCGKLYHQKERLLTLHMATAHGHALPETAAPDDEGNTSNNNLRPTCKPKTDCDDKSFGNRSNSAERTNSLSSNINSNFMPPVGAPWSDESLLRMPTVPPSLYQLLQGQVPPHLLATYSAAMSLAPFAPPPSFDAPMDLTKPPANVRPNSASKPDKFQGTDHEHFFYWYHGIWKKN